MTERTLLLGIGNVLMCDEGVGVEVVRELERRELPPGVTPLDGGTGSFTLLGPLQEADRIVIVDATVDGEPPGTVRRLEPRYSGDYPPTLTAHDIGLKDLLDAYYLLGGSAPVVLYAVSIDAPQQIGVGLSDTVGGAVIPLAERICGELRALDPCAAAL